MRDDQPPQRAIGRRYSPTELRELERQRELERHRLMANALREIEARFRSSGTKRGAEIADRLSASLRRDGF